MDNNHIKIFNFSEIHGSELCFRKILNLAICKERPDAIVINGNISGNKVIPIHKPHKSQKTKDFMECEYEGKNYTFSNEEEVNKFMTFLAAKGDYGFKCTPIKYELFCHNQTERNKIIEKQKIKRVKDWLKIIDESLLDNYSKIFFVPGTDDPFEIDKLLEKNKKVFLLNNKIIHLNEKVTLLGFSYSAFNSTNGIPDQFRYKLFYRNIDETQILIKFDEIVKRYEEEEDFSNAIFYIPYPPLKTNLDTISNGKNYSIGSKKIKDIIKSYKPKYSMHSFLFENKIGKIGKTILINPGSEYYSGKILFEIIGFNDGEFYNYPNVTEPFPNINMPNDPENSEEINSTFFNIILSNYDLIPYGGKYIKRIKEINDNLKKDSKVTSKEETIEEIKKYLDKL